MFLSQLTNCAKPHFKLLALLLVAGLPLSNARSADDNNLFSEKFIDLSVTSIEVSKKRNQIRILSGNALIDMIEIIESNEKLIGLKKEFLLMQSVTRLRLLLQEALRIDNSNLIPAERATYLEQLQLLSELKSVTKRRLSDGNHSQIVKAFPFDEAAKSSIKWILDIEKSNVLWRMMENFRYDQILAELPIEKNQQVQLLKQAIAKLDPSKLRSLLAWSRGTDQAEAKLPAEVILTVALNQGDLLAAAAALSLDDDIILHHYFSKINTDYNPEQRFEFFKTISKIANHASIAMYQIEQLTIDVELKVNFFMSSLADSNSGSSAAHILSRDLSTDQVNDLTQIIEMSQHLVEQKNALLALLLSDNPFAKQKISELYKASKMAPKLAREVTSWVE